MYPRARCRDTAGAERGPFQAIADVGRAILEFAAKPIDVDETIG
jgi:hypothetical protein